MQSLSDAQVSLQAPVPQMYGAQVWVVAVPQLPLPLQNAAGVKVVPLQDADPHWTEVDASWQLPPLHRPVLPQVVDTGQSPCGSGELFETAWQVPVPDTLQD